jgi:ABC-type bacteriocin/lantibiotic exporter with double-glycine peptidase domain
MEQQKNKLEMKRILIIAVVTLALIVLFFFVKNYMAARAIEEQQKQEKYYNNLVENCVCLEKLHIICPEGYEYNRTSNFCVKDNYFTYSSKKCSKFDCNGTIHELNLETNKWN